MSETSAEGSGPVVTGVPQEVVLRLPEWSAAYVAASPERFPDHEARMRFVLGAAEEQVRAETGGPFAAAVFERGSGRLLALGVNLVVPTNACIAHAEMVALALAGSAVGGFDLRPHGAELVTTAEPCAMCLGALPWSGIVSLVCGVRDEAIRSVGFDEGHKPDDWVEALGQRGIEVTRDVLGDEALAVLRAYTEGGGMIYNGAAPAGG